MPYNVKKLFNQSIRVELGYFKDSINNWLEGKSMFSYLSTSFCFVVLLSIALSNHFFLLWFPPGARAECPAEISDVCKMHTALMFHVAPLNRSLRLRHLNDTVFSFDYAYARCFWGYKSWRCIRTSRFLSFERTDTAWKLLNSFKIKICVNALSG